jgi:heme/copper-type cytochrome/quinol oxidase subunit 2
MSKIISQIIKAAVATSPVAALIPSVGAFAATPPCEGGNLAGCAQGGVNSTGGGDAEPLTDTVKNIINWIIYVIGFVAVAMVIYGGVQYTTSAGAADKVTKAKNTIMYGVIGLIIAILAFAVVNFVLGMLVN